MTTTTATTRRRPIGLTITSDAPPALKLSADRKTSPLVRRRKHRAEPIVLNAFGLPAGPDAAAIAAAADAARDAADTAADTARNGGDTAAAAAAARDAAAHAAAMNSIGGGSGTCPDATAACVSCYADAIPYPAARNLLAHNYAALAACGDDVDAMAALIGEMLDRFAADAAARGTDTIFRIHWSGDYFSPAYAAAWVVAARRRPQITFWHYTRSFQTVGAAQIFAAADLPNVSTYVSVDEHNAAAAADVLAAHPQLHAAALGATFDDAAAVLRIARRDDAARAPQCPENAGRMALVVTADRRRPLDTIGTDGMGACAACGLCVYGRRDVLFSVSGR